MAKTSIFGIYPTRAALEKTLTALKDAGFRETDVSVLLPATTGNKDLGYETNTKAPEGIATGATSGAIVGGTLGWLVGIGMLAIPGLGPLLAAGPIVAALAGLGAGAAAGGTVGGLIGLELPEIEAKRYDGRIRSGGILLSVHCDDSEWEKRAKEILEATGAEDVVSVGEAKADFDSTERPHWRSTTEGAGHE